VVDLKTLKVTKTIDVGKVPSEIVMSKDGKKAYVSNNGSNDISVINLADWKVDETIAAGKFADGMALAR